MKWLGCVGSYKSSYIWSIFGVAKARSDRWVRMTRFLVAIMTSQSTFGVIQLSSSMMQKSGESDDNNVLCLHLCLHFFQVCLNWLFIPVWWGCIVKPSDNFIYCHFLFVYVFDVIDYFQHLSIHYVNFK